MIIEHLNPKDKEKTLKADREKHLTYRVKTKDDSKLYIRNQKQHNFSGAEQKWIIDPESYLPPEPPQKKKNSLKEWR